MKLSTENKGLRYRVGERKAIEILAGVGFDAIDYTFTPHMEVGDMPWTGDGYKEYAKEVKKIADDNGVVFNQAHSPFIFNFDYLPDFNRGIMPLQIRCMESCALLGIPRMAVHPLYDRPYRHENRKLLWDLNVEYFNLLKPYAKQYGVKMSLENLFDIDPVRNYYVETMFSDPYELAKFYDELNDRENFDVLVDTGHCGITGTGCGDFLRIMKDRVKALHVHDNSNRGDDHLMPYDGDLDWDDIMKSLAEIGYDGDLTFEALYPYDKIDISLCTAKAKYLHDVGRCLIAKFDAYSKELEK